MKLGSRGSPLALAQSRLTRSLLAAQMGINGDEEAKAAFPITRITTTGDRITDRRLIDAGGKGLFTKEVEQALLDGDIDVAVHSMKDMPVMQPGGLKLAGFLPREDPREALISSGATSLAALPKGARIGTASLRRQAQVQQIRPDCVVETLRGNVGTRLAKIAAGEFDATFLALAGLKRLGMADKASGIIEADEMLPAPAQGAIGLQVRERGEASCEVLVPILCTQTAIRLAAERAFLAALDGSCRTPIAALAEISGENLRFRGAVYTPNGDKSWACDVTLLLGQDPVQKAAKRGEVEGKKIAALAGDEMRWEG
ncbi:MAG: hydroxymethylbilane synthase [Robiginitomaculum sp.]|nr:MAG: hydroxymethylbilane synthase [Robiginitomaculum sp.]